jgi:hypothetical protein
LVMTGDGRLVEVQAGGEEATFAQEDLAALLDLGRRGIRRILTHLRQELGEFWPARRRTRTKPAEAVAQTAAASNPAADKVSKGGQKRGG